MNANAVPIARAEFSGKYTKRAPTNAATLRVEAEHVKPLAGYLRRFYGDSWWHIVRAEPGAHYTLIAGAATFNYAHAFLSGLKHATNDPY